MSVATYITSIESSRNVIRNKLIELGMAASSDKLEKLAAEAVTEEGKQRSRTLRPMTDAADVKRALGEPTAALDPIAEAEIYSKFDEIVGDKTAIYISHRLSSCRFCDKIVVFDQGEIVQIGTHEELLTDENGKYYEMWHAQAQYYTENKTS